MSVIWPSTGATIGAATHGCWLRLTYDFGSSMGMVNLTSATISEASNHDGQTGLSFGSYISGGFDYSDPNHKITWYNYYRDTTGLHNDTYTLTYSYYWMTMSMPPGSGTVTNATATFEVYNAYVVEAKDAVRDVDSGFCLFDPDDTQNGYDTMQVAVDVADQYVASYNDTTRITVEWCDPETGESLHSEYDDVVIASDGTASATLEWDGVVSGSPVAKGPYAYTATVGQPAGIAPVVTYDWESPAVSVSDVAAQWLGNGNSTSNTARAFWTAADSEGGEELTSTEVTAVRGDFAVTSFGSVPNELDEEQSAEKGLAPAASKEDDVPWWFLVRVKDKHPELNRAHLCRYGLVTGVLHPKLIADDFNRPDVTLQASLDDTAALFQQKASYVATARGEQSVSYALNRWDNYSNVWFAAAHGDAGVIELADDDFLTGTALATHDGALRLAIFVSCYSANTSQTYGNLCSAALDAGAEAAVGFTQKLQVSNLANDPGKQWCRQFWAALSGSSVVTDDAACTMMQAIDQAEQFFADARRRAHFGAYFESGFWSSLVFGDSGETLWPN